MFASFKFWVCAYASNATYTECFILISTSIAQDTMTTGSEQQIRKEGKVVRLQLAVHLLKHVKFFNETIEYDILSEEAARFFRKVNRIQIIDKIRCLLI